MDSHWIAWAAGVFEGDGSVCSCSNGSGSRTLSCQLQMSDEDTVRRFAEAVGLGSVCGPYPPYGNPINGVPRSVQGKKDRWKWQVYGDNARDVIEMFWPYLQSRRRARAAELWISTVNKNNRMVPGYTRAGMPAIPRERRPIKDNPQA